MTVVRFKKFSDLARHPTYAKPGDSGADLVIANLGELTTPLYPGHTAVVWTDIGIELPHGYEAQVRPRSSVSRKGLLVHHGTVDGGYRGNIGVTVTNVGMTPSLISIGDRLAQLVIAPVAAAEFELVDELEDSERGTGGYGSSDRPAGNSG